MQKIKIKFSLFLDLNRFQVVVAIEPKSLQNLMTML